MTKLNAYSIYDVKALWYNSPFFATTDAAAARAFGDLVNDQTTSIARHPADYVLYCVGTFLDTTGELEPISPRRHVADGASFVRLQPTPLFDIPEGTTEDYANSYKSGAI